MAAGWPETAGSVRLTWRPNASFPNPPFERGIGNTIRPVQWELENPRLHVWNASVQRTLPAELVGTVGYAGSHGTHLFRIRKLCEDAGLIVYTSPRAPMGHIGAMDMAMRYFHEMLSYTALRMHVNLDWMHE